MATWARIVDCSDSLRALDVVEAENLTKLQGYFTAIAWQTWEEANVGFRQVSSVDANDVPLRHGASFVGGDFLDKLNYLNPTT